MSLQIEAGGLISKGEYARAISVHYGIVRRYRDSFAACEMAYADLGGLLDGSGPRKELFQAHPRLQLSEAPHPIPAQLNHTLANRWDQAITMLPLASDSNPEVP